MGSVSRCDLYVVPMLTHSLENPDTISPALSGGLVPPHATPTVSHLSLLCAGAPSVQQVNKCLASAHLLNSSLLQSGGRVLFFTSKHGPALKRGLPALR